MCVCVCVCAGEEELHGKLEEDRFLFSQENNDAACDVLDLREVVSVFDRSAGYGAHAHALRHNTHRLSLCCDGGCWFESRRSNHEFEIVTLTDKLLCSADIRETLLAHLTHILKVHLSVGLSVCLPARVCLYVCLCLDACLLF